MVAAWWSNLMPQNYATRTGEASCEPLESRQAPQSYERVTNSVPVPLKLSPDKELLPSKDTDKKLHLKLQKVKLNITLPC